MTYPGRVLKQGETDRKLVAAIIQALTESGYAVATKRFDAELKSTLKLFQAHHVDSFGRPLRVDGEVGPNTWSALFPVTHVAAPPATGLGAAALQVALAEVGVTEVPLGSNGGPRVDQYLASVKLPSGNFWCMAFVHFCFQEAARVQGVSNPFPQTGHCITAWTMAKKAAPASVLARADAVADPQLVRPGMVFVHDYGNGHGHTGFVLQVRGGPFTSIEGNADPQGGRNGLAVLEVNKRSVIDKSLKGFIAF